jgi:hypothetical protein
MSRPARETAPWFLWPVAAVWDLVAFLVTLTGRLIGVVLGLTLLTLGLVLTLTVVLAPVGVPIMVVGILLMVRSFF